MIVGDVSDLVPVRGQIFQSRILSPQKNTVSCTLDPATSLLSRSFVWSPVHAKNQQHQLWLRGTSRIALDPTNLSILAACAMDLSQCPDDFDLASLVDESPTMSISSSQSTLVNSSQLTLNNPSELTRNNTFQPKRVAGSAITHLLRKVPTFRAPGRFPRQMFGHVRASRASQ